MATSLLASALGPFPLSAPALLIAVVLILVTSLGLYVYSLRRGSKGSVPLSGRWVVVTGCDSGFGLATVASLVTRNSGLHVIATCLTSEGASRARQAGATEALVCDFRDSAALVSAAERITALCGGELWAVVHNAGIVRPGFIDFQPISNFREVMEVNFFAVVQLNHRLMPCVKKAKGRKVILSSVCGFVSLPGNAPYSAAKFALESFADALRVESSFWGVQVSLICPGTMKTPIVFNFYELCRATWRTMEKQDPDGLWKKEWPESWLHEYISLGVPKILETAEDPALVVACICDAVEAHQPKLRYLAGRGANTSFYHLWVMPESWAFSVKKSVVVPPPPVVTLAAH